MIFVNNSRLVAYTEIMEKLILSEKQSHCQYIAYAAGALAKAAEGQSTEIRFVSGRVELVLCGQEKEMAVLHKLAAEKIAEIICIGYKYEYFRSLIRPAGLCEEDREILLAAILAADFAEDSRYVRTRLEGIGEHSLDGFYNFRLRNLQEKWKSIAACVPGYFTESQLTEFMEYLLGASKGKVFLRGSEVYDGRCRRLRRATLIEDGKSEMGTLREIVLSGAGKVECLSALSSRQEKFLRRYYAGRVAFFS